MGYFWFKLKKNRLKSSTRINKVYGPEELTTCIADSGTTFLKQKFLQITEQ